MFELAKTKVNEYGKRYQIDLAYLIKNEFWVYLRLGISLIIGLAVLEACFALSLNGSRGFSPILALYR